MTMRRAFAADGLKADIRRRIETGEIPPGARIPPARELARSYSLSYATCHKALAELEKEGLLLRQQGRGTFVADSSAAREGTVLRVRLLADEKTRPRAAAALGEFAADRPALRVLRAAADEIESADVIQVMSYEGTRLADGLLPLDGLAGRLLSGGDIDPAALRVFRVLGAQRAVPGFISPTAFYCNRRLFRKAKVELPESWTIDEFIEIASRLAEGLAGSAASVLFPRLYILMPVFWNHGVEPSKDESWGLLSDGAPAALESLRRWRRAGAMPIGNNGCSQLGKLIREDQLAAAPWSGGLVPEVLGGLGEDLAVLPYPTGPAGRATGMAAEGFGISARTRDPELAMELVEKLVAADAADVAGLGIRLAARRGLRTGDRIDRAIEESVPFGRVVVEACDRDVFGLVDRLIAEFVESDEPAAAFAARAGSVVRALLAAQADKGKGAGEFLG